MVNLEEICKRYEAAGLYTHVYASCGFLHKKKPALTYAYLPDERSIFDLSSLTKALVTTPLSVWFCQEKSKELATANLDALFGADLTNLICPNIGAMSLRNILRHETGLPAWRNFYVECEGRRQILEEALARAEQQWNSTGPKADVYSDVGFMLLGQLLEIFEKQKLINLWWATCEKNSIKSSRNLLWQGVIDSKKAISTGYCPVRNRQLLGEVHDENCWAMGGFTGHAGLFGSGPDVENFIKELWLSPAGRFVFDANFAEANTSGESLMGWRKGRDYSANSFAEGRGCGHLGFTGTAFWVDPVTKTYAILLTNRVISARISPTIKDFRQEAFAAMWNALQL